MSGAGTARDCATPAPDEGARAPARLSFPRRGRYSRAVAAARGRGERAGVLLALSVLAYVLVASAWQCDDAWITFRTARNAWQGQGLTWNPGERVQAFTHPLWLLLAILAHAVSGEFFYSMSLVSLVGLTRLDALLLLAPAWAWCSLRGRRALSLSALGLLPLVAWGLFSLAYYGSLLPNTALAKLNRIGHYPWPIPAGYLVSRATGENRIVEPRLREAYEAIRLVTRGPLWTAARWRAIWELNTGRHAGAFAAAAAPGSGP